MPYTDTLARPVAVDADSGRYPTIIDAHGIQKSYGTTTVLTGVDLTVRRGTVFALLGPNGAGKSTLVRILSTLTRADAGTATIAGVDLNADPDGVKEAISLTGQHAAVDERLTGRENLRMIGRLRRLDRRSADARSTRLIADFDLTDVADRRVRTYSIGTKRKLDLALSLLTRPPLIFLDEPTTGLDPRSREALWTLIRRLMDDGVTIFLTTQYLEEADRLADHIAVLSAGRIVAEGSAAELKARVGGEVVALEYSGVRALTKAAAAVGVPLPPGRDGLGEADATVATAAADDALADRLLEIPTDGTGRALRHLLDVLSQADAEPDRVTVRRPSLDDVFLSLTDTTMEPTQ
jgi:ABC-2 type transport system ATP-binding protein